MKFDAPWTEPDGRMTHRVGQGRAADQIFTRMNEEMRRHARALRANFISNPTWSIFNLRHLITAHPLGGCPMGDDYLQGAVDEFGRVFAGDGSVHEGLFVADGSLIPSRARRQSVPDDLRARRALRRAQDPRHAGRPVPEARARRSHARRSTRWTSSIAAKASSKRCSAAAPPCRSRRWSIRAARRRSTSRHADHPQRRVLEGLLPEGAHPERACPRPSSPGFKKQFYEKDGKYTGITSDTDGRITARNTPRRGDDRARQSGTLEPGKYILLRYLDPPWQGFYDIFKIINDDLMIGRVYLGEYPNGARVFTFPMSRRYGFDADDRRRSRRALYAPATVPTKAELDGVWRMDTVSNANHAGGVAYLEFEQQARRPPGGALPV